MPVGGARKSGSVPEAFKANMEQFLNDETTITVLRVLVLLMALLWLLTGFRFLDRKPGKKRRKGGGGDR